MLKKSLFCWIFPFFLFQQKNSFSSTKIPTHKKKTPWTVSRLSGEAATRALPNKKSPTSKAAVELHVVPTRGECLGERRHNCDQVSFQGVWDLPETNSFGFLLGWPIFRVVFSNIFYFHPYLGEMIQFDEHIFQMGWFNHQPVDVWNNSFLLGPGLFSGTVS